MSCYEAVFKDNKVVRVYIQGDAVNVVSKNLKTNKLMYDVYSLSEAEKQGYIKKI